MTATDRIEKKILLGAPRSRVWEAITNAADFGAWFGAKLESEFAVGARATGSITSPGYEHVKMAIIVERMDAETLFSFRWHPDAVDPDTDYATEPTTLVEFRLEEVAEGTQLTLVESGFDQIPAGRRDAAFRGNEEGWAAQVENIKRYVEG